MSSDRDLPQNPNAGQMPDATRPAPALSAPSTAMPSTTTSNQDAPSPHASTDYARGAADHASTQGANNGGGNGAFSGNVSGNGGGGNGNGGGEGVTGVGGDLQKRALMDHLMTSLARDSLAPEEKPGPSRMTSMMGVLRRRWQPMLLVFLLTLPLIAWKFKPGETTYVAETRMILPSSGGGSGILTELSGLKSAGDSKLATQMAILTSPKRIQAALDSLPRGVRMRGWKGGTPSDQPVAASSMISPDIIDISASSSDPAASVALANAVVKSYADYTKGQSRQSDVKSLRFVYGKLRSSKKDLVKAKRDLQSYKERYNIFNIERALETSTTQIETLTQKASEARIEVNAGVTSTAIQNDATAMALRQKAIEARLNLDAVLREYTESAPEARKARQDYLDAQEQSNTRTATLMQAGRQRLSDTESALAAAKSRAAVLPSLEFKLSQLVDNGMAAAANYRTLSDKYNSLLIATSAQTAVPYALTPAEQARQVVPTWMRPLLLGTLAALVLASMLAAVLEQMDNTLHTTDDLEPLLRTSLLGTMPLLRNKAERRLTHIKNPSIEAPVLLEACRILRSNLTFASVDAPLRSVLVTSADPGEGKSLSALNLAAVMAMDGRRVVLLDCDLRRPTQHLLSEVVPEPGFSNILTGESTLEETLRPTTLANLSIIPAGTLPPNPPELLGSEHGRRLLRDLRERFDLVVIDSPPVLSLADPQVLASMVDGVVLVVAANSTSKDHLQRAQSIMRHAGGRLLGVVFNKVRERNDIHNANNYYTYSALDNNANRGVAGLLKRR